MIVKGNKSHESLYLCDAEGITKSAVSNRVTSSDPTVQHRDPVIRKGLL